MHSAGETERLVNAAKLEEKLQKPGNQLNALRLLQALTVKEIYGAKRQLSLIEAGFVKLQEANAKEGIRNKTVEKQLEELRNDKESFRLVISEAESSTQNTKDGLENLRAKVSDEYFKLTADNARFGKDIKTLNKHIDRHREQLSTVEESLGDFRSKLPDPQDIATLNDSLLRLETTVKSMYEKLDTVSTTTFEQKQALLEIASDQTRARQSLETFVPKQEDFFQFLRKVTERSSAAVSDESILNGTTNEGDIISLGPQPPLKAVQMLEQYNHFSNSYRIKRPKSDARFIRQYLKKIDHRAAWLIQMRLQQEYPELVEPLQKAETSSKTDVMIFVNIEKISWDHIKIIMRKINGKELFNLLEIAQEGPTMSVANRGPIIELK
ncbi:uncharacterized protein F4822DRAFT_419794 [Hypoxylon trugodes]|uniref:uncharacterized protein n=1 Tax=Hypoxylon trugodes TaxID=326681 RepID=UPI00219D45B4|nr:uncharacterized protein F4822DRAFT_419794 [Hypoxylon trugodes]KAI1383230.1 hypothetical protein F4822DRAFT_419794 [Hypoxylon trugodes]